MADIKLILLSSFAGLTVPSKVHTMQQIIVGGQAQKYGVLIWDIYFVTKILTILQNSDFTRLGLWPILIFFSP